GLMALQEALELLEERPGALALVGGVDTYLDAALLRSLEEQRRLMTGSNRDGFFPGEGAAFLLLGSPGTAARAQRAPLAEVLAVALGRERGHRESPQPYLGDGLAEAFRGLFASIPAGTPRVGCVYAGLNGEHFWAKEWGVAFTRSAERFAQDVEVEH